ncbi:MAG: DUF1592 domain-containing protein [Planctomycetales bacterium]
MQFALFLCATESVAAEISGPDAATFQKTIRPLLQKHCLRCHSGKKQEADFRVDTLGPDILQEKKAEIWHELINRVNSGEMPPKKEPRLSQDELTQLSDWVFAGLKRVSDSAQGSGGRVVIRRLNRQEYNNTIRDLVGVPFEAGADFPSDPAAYGFDNVGSALSVSPLHMTKYVLAARKVLDRAIVTGEQPKRERWRIQAERRSKEDRGYYYENDEKYGNTGVFTTREARDDRGRRILWALGDTSKHFPSTEFHHLRPVEKTRFSGGTLKGLDFTYPVAGEYIIRVRAYGHYAKPDMPGHYLFGPPRLNVTSHGLPVLQCDVPATEDAPKAYETRFYADALTTDIYIRNRTDYSFQQIRRDVGSFGRWSIDQPIPFLAVDWYEIDGPVYEQWPPESHTRILFPSENRENEDVYAREVIEAFATRAFRRPASQEEVDRLVEGFKRARPNKANFEEAIKVPLIAVLCSPGFLFLTEPLPDGEDEARPLDDFELASRLSYFLWSSMPDGELSTLAKDGKLRDAGVLDRQINRMLKDRKSRALVDNFTGQWLGLRKLGDVTPDLGMFPRFGEHLEKSIASEARSFFAEILENDLSVINFVDSDFVMLNERLARFYEIEGVRGEHFRKVPLKPKYHRGGLLTQAAMLLMTSNGTRTSPVKRGVWILENVLGDPPSPPPPDAGEIPPPKVPGPRQATVRERLALHRSTPACAACHAKIDPLGFALENYDGSGFYREKESSRDHVVPHPQDPDVDPSGELPDGRSFTGVEELKQIMLEEEDKFLNCLSEKLLVYALGRGLGYADRATVEELSELLKRNDYHLRGLITNIVKTKAFQTK